ncbi:MAG: beta-galactosidase, partial [Clostridia bacterium]|nr:beta-galactosidase [Clostridia bacterium]
ISHIKATPNAETGEVYYEITCENANGMVLTCSASFEGEDMGSAGTTVMGKVARFVLPLKEKHLWDIGQGNLYDVSLLLGEDAVSSYFGLRDVYYDGRAMVLNGRRVYQRLVLDQGFYPDGIWTAPTDDELCADIERSMAMGFNGARLHQKVFEPRFLYHCDRLGYIVWGEHASWGLDLINNTCWAGFLPEWLEILRRDYNHPAIVGWCPLNETWREQDRQFVEMLYDMTKAFDPYRMFIDCSGWYHMKTEVVDEHNYCQNPDELREYYETLSVTGQPKFPNPCTPYPTEYTPKGVSFISEYGGSGWDYTDGGIGHGDLPATIEDFIARFKGLTDVLLDNPALSGFCYTQLTDVEQEQNGMYKYNRTPKFSAEIISAIVSRRAAIEDED